MAAAWAGKKVGWLKKISALKKLLADVGPLWTGTELSGLDNTGPYHCEDCIYLRGRKAGEIFKDSEGFARCEHAVVIADPKSEKDEKGIPVIRDPYKMCCEFVDNKGLVEIEDQKKE